MKTSKKLRKLINDYNEHCKVFYSHNTAKSYIKFANKYINTLNLEEIYKAIFLMKVKDTTKNAYIAALNSFKEFLDKNAIPFKKIKVNGSDKVIPSGYHKLSTIFEILKDKALSPDADKYDLAIYILIRTGMRFGNSSDPDATIDFSYINGEEISDQNIRVRSKGNKYKGILLPPNLDHSKLSQLNNINKRTLQKRLNSSLKDLELQETLTVHTTRYLFANYNKKIGLTIDEIMRIGGGSSSAVMTYLYDNVDEFNKLAEFQYLTDIEQIEQLDYKGQAEHYRKLYLEAMRKLKAKEAE